MVQETQPGTVIGGRFRLDEELARGGFGIVWRAHDLDLDVGVAVKEVYLPPATSPKEHSERLARARREAQNAAALRDQPYIVAVHDVITEDDRPWMVMRLVDGHSLERHLETEGPLPVETAAHAARCLLQALAAAHGAGIIHRDVKPANVMLADDEFLLTDFGIAVHSTDTSLTTTGAFIGSLEYVAPERANGAEDHPASDLFSLGATLYQGVEGTSPFRRANPTATLTALLTEPPPPPQHAGRLEPLITALLEKDPDQRPTVTEALALLDVLESTTTASEKTTEVVRRVPKPTKVEVRATASARKRADEQGIDLPTVKGTGPGGVITVQDVYTAEGKSAKGTLSGFIAKVMGGTVILGVLAVIVHIFDPDETWALTGPDVVVILVMVGICAWLEFGQSEG